PNYPNDHTTIVGADGYIAAFGKSVNDGANDGGITVPQSSTMASNNWTTALKVTVNKRQDLASIAGLNLYPQGVNVGGNVALRFDMYIAVYDLGVLTPASGTPAREFATFGLNHYGTNCNWRTDFPLADGLGNRPMNADGEWAMIDAASGSITPADYD